MHKKSKDIETDRLRKLQHTQPAIDQRQMRIVSGYENMGTHLEILLHSGECTQVVERLTIKLHTLIGEPGSVYGQTMMFYFFQMCTSIKERLQSPFITAFLDNSFCTAEERSFIDTLRCQQALSSTDETKFYTWLKNRMIFFTKGFQYMVMKDSLIPRLSQEEINRHNIAKFQRWAEADPEAATAHQLRASKLGSETGPDLYTSELRTIIQMCFDNHMNYQETCLWLEENRGISLSVNSLKKAVAAYDDLDYTPVLEHQQKLREELIHTVVTTFEATNRSRKETYRLLEQEGISPGVAHYILRQEGVRSHINWLGEIEIYDTKTNLTHLLLWHIEIHAPSNLSLEEEYEKFIALLNSTGYQDTADAISKSRYVRKRSHLLQV